MEIQTLKTEIPKDWSIQVISEVAEISGGSTPKSTNPEFWDGGIFWLTPKELTKRNSVHIEKSERTITQEGLENGPRKLYSPGHVLMTSRAPVGIPVINDSPMAVNQGFIAISCKKIDNHFMYYWIKNNLDYLERNSNGTTFLELSKSNFRTLEILCPNNIEEGKKIAQILYNFDKQIENIINQNKLSEQIVQSIFKSWFVNFDGVKEFEDSELGQIPRGWHVGKFSDISNTTSGKRPDFISQIYTELYNIPLYGASGIMGYVRNALYQKPIILTGRVGTIGVIQNIFEDCYPSDNTLVILPNKDFFHHYVANFLKTVDFDSIKGGSTQPLITQTSLKNIDCLIPEKNILEKFEKISKNLQLMSNLKKYHIIQLIKIRDSLLPKLMSGEIRV